MSELPDDPELHVLLKREADRFTAPETLLDQVRSDIRSGTKNARKFTWSWSGFGLGQMTMAFVAGLVVAATFSSILTGRSSSSQGVLYALAADHARAIVTTTTIEVPSSDRHTVKPWLSAKLGYSPTVVDMADAEYPLLGGRRGYLGGVPLAVMVYGYKAHEIDVYSIRPNSGIELPPDHATLDGYHVATWKLDGIDYVAMSDIDQERLDAFAHLLKTRQSSPA
jgi:anti-sigma factor RsiW